MEASDSALFDGQKKAVLRHSSFFNTYSFHLFYVGNDGLGIFLRYTGFCAD